MSNLSNALWITVIGMGLVFLAILLLWGLMALLVRLTGEKELGPLADETSSPADAAAAPSHVDLVLSARKRKAAVAAVAVVLARKGLREQYAHPAEHAASGVNLWQAVHRASELKGRANLQKKQVIR